KNVNGKGSASQSVKLGRLVHGVPAEPICAHRPSDSTGQSAHDTR
ncbi:MAG: hypothetical protein ACI90M_002738, partial [Candidatus Azotimanducaceae bacterium]